MCFHISTNHNPQSIVFCLSNHILHTQYFQHIFHSSYICCPGCIPAFKKQTSSQIILSHSKLLFIIKPTPPFFHLIQSLFVPTHLYSSPTSTYSFPFSPVSFIAHTSQSYFFIHSSNSICFSLVQIFLSFFHTTFTINFSSLPFFYTHTSSLKY